MSKVAASWNECGKQNINLAVIIVGSERITFFKWEKLQFNRDYDDDDGSADEHAIAQLGMMMKVFLHFFFLYFRWEEKSKARLDGFYLRKMKNALDDVMSDVTNDGNEG